MYIQKYAVVLINLGLSLWCINFVLFLLFVYFQSLPWSKRPVAWPAFAVGLRHQKVTSIIERNSSTSSSAAISRLSCYLFSFAMQRKLGILPNTPTCVQLMGNARIWTWNISEIVSS